MSRITGNNPDNVVGTALYGCEKGYYLPLPSCPECKGCPAGQFVSSSSAAAAVETCPGATSSDHQPPPVACRPCLAGQFQDRTGQPSCIDCPAGKFGSIQGSTSSDCSGAGPAGTDCAAGGCSAATPLIPGRVYSVDTTLGARC